MRAGRIASVVVACAAIVVGWLLLAPPAVGGSARYVVAEGSSMLPAIRGGDLIVVREAPSYEPGDVVAYRAEGLGVVLHRVIAIEGDRLVMKGDNNTWVDSARAAPQDVLGSMRIRVPWIGSVVVWLQRPANAALAGGVFVGIVALIALWRRRRGSAPAPVPATVIVSHSGAGRRVALTSCVIGAMGAFVVAGAAFARPAVASQAAGAAFEHRTHFDYAGTVAAGVVYPAGRVSTGDPLFLRVVDGVDVSYRHEIVGPGVGDVRGSAQLDAVLSDDNGWRATIPLKPAEAFRGRTVAQSARLDLAAIERLTTEVQRQTGVRRDGYRLRVVATVDVDADAAGSKVRSLVTPSVTFNVTPGLAAVARDADRDPFVLVQPAAAPGREVRTTAHLAVGAVRVPVPAARAGGLAAALMLSAAGLALAIANRRAGPAAQLGAAYGIDPTPVVALPEGRVVDVASLDALGRLAARANAPVLHQSGDGWDGFAAVLEGTVFRYVDDRT